MYEQLRDWKIQLKDVGCGFYCCTSGMYIRYVHQVCTSGMYIRYVHQVCTSGMYT